MRKLFVIAILLQSGLVEGRAQNVQKSQEMTVPATQSVEMDVPLDPWSEVSAEESSASSESQPSVETKAYPGNFSIDFQLRGRAEYRNGQGALHSTSALPAWFVGERARLALNFKRGVLSAKVSGQHVGVWGDDNLESTKGKLGIHEAWARLDAPQGWFAQFGRQVLSYDDERIFGANDWSASGYAHDAFRLGYEHGMHRLHGIVAFSQSEEKTVGGTYYDGPVPYKNLQFLWYHFGNEQTPFQFSLMGLNHGYEIGRKNLDGVMVPRTGYMQTVGGWLQYKKNDFFGKAEGYYQLGHDKDKRPVAAYLGGVRLGYQGSVWGLSLGGDYVSGSKVSGGYGENNCFNLLYGSSHIFYGHMDHFTNNNMLSCGLIDGVASAYCRPLKNLSLNIDYHYFMTGVERTRLHRQLGHEIDFGLRYQVLKDVCVEAGYSLMMPTSVMVYFEGGSNKCRQDWGWLSLNFSPRIFSSVFKR